MSNLEQVTVSIRPMKRSDIRAVLALDSKIRNGQDHPIDKELGNTNPEGSIDVSFVAEVGGNTIGFIIARLAHVMIPLTEVCMLQGILVDPDYQNRGIGIRLLGNLVGYCQDKGISTIRTPVEKHNDDLRRFFERLGFRLSTIVNYDKTIEGK